MMGAFPVRAVVMMHTVVVRPFVPVVAFLAFIEQFHFFSIPELDGDPGSGALAPGIMQPMRRAAVVKVEPILILASDRRGAVELRGGLDGFTGKPNAD